MGKKTWMKPLLASWGGMLILVGGVVLILVTYQSGKSRKGSSFGEGTRSRHHASEASVFANANTPQRAVTRLPLPQSKPGGSTDAGMHEPAELAPPGPAHAMAPEELERQAKVFFSRLDSLMNEESVDRSWAGAAEVAVSNLYAAPTFEESQLQRVTCRRTMCRMEATHGSPQAYDRWLTRLPLPETGFYKRFTRRSVEADGRIATVTIMVRDGHDVPADIGRDL